MGIFKRVKEEADLEATNLEAINKDLIVGNRGQVKSNESFKNLMMVLCQALLQGVMCAKSLVTWQGPAQMLQSSMRFWGP